MDSLKDPRLLVRLDTLFDCGEGWVQMKLSTDLLAELRRLQTLAQRYGLTEAVVAWPMESCCPDNNTPDLSDQCTPMVVAADTLIEDDEFAVVGSYLQVSAKWLVVLVERDNDDADYSSLEISLDEIFQIAENSPALG